MIKPFSARHNGPRDADIATMLEVLGQPSLEALSAAIVPADIRDANTQLQLPEALSEEAALAQLAQIAAQNKVKKSLIGQGYHGTHTPQVILRNLFLSPGWYTAYTPYQPEISQGRLELLFNFQTLIVELTGLDVANASLLDEATAAAEAMSLCQRAKGAKKRRFLVSKHILPQTLDVLRTRAEPMGISIDIVDEDGTLDFDGAFAILLQYPRVGGEVVDYSAISAAAHDASAMVIMAADPLALTLLKTPAALGADVVVGSAQRFGVPLFGGGPHAGFMAVRDGIKRNIPGRLVGLSVDAHGRPAYRLALQTREQHIRREKATSNICTAQALLAIAATLYACYHGPDGLQAIAQQVNQRAERLREGLKQLGLSVSAGALFDTVSWQTDQAEAMLQAAADAGYNLGLGGEPSQLRAAVDETIDDADIEALLTAIAKVLGKAAPSLAATASSLPSESLRQGRFLEHECFHAYHSETDMMRYLRRLANRDLALDRAMIPLGSCTMKLNAAAEMAPITWPEFSDMHPLAPADQQVGYQRLVDEVESMLAAVTGYAKVSVQPNSGSQGEFAGLLAIRSYHEANGDHQRDVCLIPSSAHGTNPASAQMAGMRVVVVKCDAAGNVDLDDLEAKIERHSAQLAAIMITYPSTHGVFEVQVRKLCAMVHDAGGQVYIDGANLNAQVGLARPGHYGGDVSHLNLHKTFCIPHGGGGPGVGPIGVAAHLVPYLPGHQAFGQSLNAVSAAPWGSAGILPITWMYLRMMGADALREATQIALLNANYIAARLRDTYPVLYSGAGGLVAHECILDTRMFKEQAGVTVDDIAKRLIDFGFHAPTMSFPVAGTLMVEPTESESKQELDRFCSAMLQIHAEIEAIANGQIEHAQSALAHAPHTTQELMSDDWQRAYSRQEGGLPGSEASFADKYWPPVSRVDNVYGDRNLVVCSCAPIESYLD